MRTDLSNSDWKALRAHAQKGLQRRLKSAPAATVEDLTQEILVTLFRLSQRGELVGAEALTTALVHRACVDHVRRMRGPTAPLEAPPRADATFELPAGEPGQAAGVDMLELFRFVVLEHFRQHDVPCHELATDFFAEQSWAAVARRLQSSHGTVIRRWSRCMEQVRELAYAQRGPVWEWARAARIV